MGNLTRLLLVSLLVVSLAACGDDDSDDGADARTTACRSYELLAGADGKRIADDLTRVVAGSGSYNDEQTTARLVAVRAAAAKAGLTEELPDADYRRFRDLVDASLGLEASLADTENSGLSSAAVARYAATVQGLQDACA